MSLLRQSLGTLEEIFADAMAVDGIPGHDSKALAQILWALFSGLVLWEESKRSLDARKNFLKPTLEMAFEVFGRGLMQADEAPPAGTHRQRLQPSRTLA
jgi:hypothetical protein